MLTRADYEQGVFSKGTALQINYKGATVERAMKQQLKTWWQSGLQSTLSTGDPCRPACELHRPPEKVNDLSEATPREQKAAPSAECHQLVNTGFTLRPENCFLPKNCYF